MKIFITGINTNVGKTFTTGLLAKEILERKIDIITMKIIQTGNSSKISEDILTHRRLMGIDIKKEDLDGLTCPYVFKFPSSPHLAARLESIDISIEKINNCIKELEKKYKIVIIEGAGGLCTPIKENITTLDWFFKSPMEIIVVTTPILGSISQTILTVKPLVEKGFKPIVFYNEFFEENETIKIDSFNYLKNYFKNLFISNEIKSIANYLLS